MLQIPYKLKHYTVEVGKNHRVKDNDVQVILYVLRNNITQIQEYESLQLPEMMEMAITLDRNMERVEDFVDSNENFKHLEGAVKEDETTAGIVVPAHMAKPDGGQGMH